MAPERSRFLRQVTFALLAVASVATEIAAIENQPLWSSLGLATIWVGLAAGLSWVVPASKDRRSIPPRFVFLILLAMSAAPFVIEPLRRRWLGVGYPLELQMVFGLRNLGLGLAAFASWLLCLRLACVVSLFLMLFCISMTSHPAVLTLLGLYSATGKHLAPLLLLDGSPIILCFFGLYRCRRGAAVRRKAPLAGRIHRSGCDRLRAGVDRHRPTAGGVCLR